MFKLVIADDEGKTTSVPLVRDEITIGRKEGNTIRLTERNVSRRHARLQKQNGLYLLHDLGSYNGTLLNGGRIGEVKQLKHGDQILIGDYKLSIVDDAAGSVSMPPGGAGQSSTGGLGGPPSAGFSQGAVVGSAGAMNPAMLSAATQPDLPAFGAAPMPVEAPAAGVPYRNGSAAYDPNGIPEELRGMRVVFIAPAGVPGPVSLDRLPLVLGRSEASDIALPFSSISREHARLFLEDGELCVEDMGSSNGVLLNGTRVRRAKVNAGDLLTLGVVEARIARRGDETVVMATDIPGLERRSPVPLVIAAVGVLALVGGAVALLSRPSDPGPAVSATASTAPSVTATPTAEPRSSATAQAAPTAIAAAPSVEPTAEPAAPTAEPAAPTADPIAPAPTALAYVDPGAARVDPRPRPTADVRAARVAPTAEPRVVAPEPRVVAPEPRIAAPEPRATAVAPPLRPSAAPSAAANAGGMSPLEEARACLRTGDNDCVINALRTRASTEPELALLASTYRATQNRAEAVRVMNRYLNRFPDGPRAESFRSYVTAQP